VKACCVASSTKALLVEHSTAGNLMQQE